MDQVGSVEIVIKGGRPWGFTLQGGIESRTALTVSEIEPRGKADRHGALKVGDHVLKINDVQCFSLADATQLIDCAFRTLTVLVWRSKSTVGIPCPQIRDSCRYVVPRYHRHSKDEGLIVRRTSAASSKGLPRVIAKEHHRCKPQESSMETSPVPKVTLTCDSHQSRPECLESGNQRKPGSGSDPPVHSNSQSLMLDRSNSALSLASTVDSQEDVVFQTHDSPNRYTRSPRNLTKDSGYETCAQTEHDYVNVEWMSSSQVPSRMPLSSPVGYPGPKKSTISNKMPIPYDNYLTGYPSMENYCQQVQSDRYDSGSFKYHSPGNSLDLSYCSDYNVSATLSTPVPYGKRSGSCSSLYSSCESLSSQSSKTDNAQIRPAKSSLVLTDKYPSVPSPSSQVDCSRQYFNKIVAPAQSAPNLHSKGEMVPRRSNKKQSVYEELACKSGFDFSPVVQRQPFWAPKQTFEGNGLHGNGFSFRSYKVEDREPKSLPANCDKIRTSENVRSYYSSAETVGNVESPVREDKISSPPPPVPTRDSSLRFRSNPTHEKFPSWPVSTPLDSEVENPQSSGYRSNSWTEQSRCSKDISESYSRPKTHFQISTQQLPPVQEKTSQSSRKPYNTNKNDRLGDHSLSKFTRDSPFSGDEAFDKLSNRFTLDSIYQNTKDIFYSSGKQYDTHSPPERDVASPLDKKATCKPIVNSFYKKAHDNTSRLSSKASDIYENLRPLVTKDINTNTPLLDRLRLESFPPWSQQQDVDAFSDTGTCISSNSGSQETLKWHGSYSDLITRARNESPAFGSDTSTIYEELRPRSADGSEKSFSTLCSSPIGYDNHTSRSNNWQQFSALPYSSPDRSNRPPESVVSKPSAFVEPKSCGYSSLTSNNLHSLQKMPGDNREDVRNGSSRLSPGSHAGRVNDAKTISPVSAYCSKPSVNSTERILPNVGVSSREHHGAKMQKSYSNMYASSGSPSQRRKANSFKSSPQEKNSAFSWDLKAIQKQAVLSFYHRQTAIDAKDASEKKAPRSSSFSYGRDGTVADRLMPPAVAQNRRRKVLSSNSFSQQISDSHHQHLSNSANARVNAFTANVPEKRFSAETPTSSVSSEGSVRHFSPPASSSDRPELDGRSDLKPFENSEKISNETIESAREVDASSYNQSDSVLKVPITARKAYLKKTCKPDENVVRILSSEGKTLAKGKTETRTCLSYPNAKPKVPPKRVQKDSSVVPLFQQVSSFSPSVLSSENAEDEELQAIENNLFPKIGILLPPCETLAPSPDLPLPPPPVSTETEVLPTDDPLPPPPDLQELSAPETNQVPNCYSCDRMNGSASHELHEYLHCDSSYTCCSVPKRSIQHAQVSITEPSLDQTDILLPLRDSSPAVVSASHTQSQDTEAIQKIEKEGEVEALYVNLNFQNKLYKNAIVESAPKTFNIPVAVSVTNSATQTSEATPSLQRRANNLPRAADHTGSSSQHLSYTSEYTVSNVFTSDYQHHLQTGLLPDMKSTNDPDGLDVHNHSTTQVPTQGNSCAPRDEIGLPLTNPYFTTSEPKAKLLTRYCQAWDKQWLDQLELKGQKEELIASISKKLNVLRLEQIELKEEMKQNEDLGEQVSAKIEKVAKPNEVRKYRIHVEELEKIINLLLSLSGRLARAENALLILPEDAKAEEKNILEAKRNKLSQQHDEAWHLKENIDRRSCQVSLFLHHYLSKEEYADYEHFIKMKSKLLMDAREIDEKIRLGEEQLAALRGTFQASHVNGEIEDKFSGEPTVLAKT